MDLFTSENAPKTTKLEMPDADVVYYPNFFDLEKSNELFETFYHNIQWKQDPIKLFGKTYLQPRLTALYANNKKTYSYSNITMTPHSFTKELIFVKKSIEQISKIAFTTCLLNLYRDGQDSNGCHAYD